MAQPDPHDVYRANAVGLADVALLIRTDPVLSRDVIAMGYAHIAQRDPGVSAGYLLLSLLRGLAESRATMCRLYEDVLARLSPADLFRVPPSLVGEPGGASYSSAACNVVELPADQVEVRDGWVYWRGPAADEPVTRAASPAPSPPSSR